MNIRIPASWVGLYPRSGALQVVTYVVWVKPLASTMTAFLAYDFAVNTVDTERGGCDRGLEKARFIRFRRSTPLSCLNVAAVGWQDSNPSRFARSQKRQLSD